MFQRFSEPYSPTGGLAAEGVLNQLGRPDIEPLEVLVREAVQNCWDARRPSELGIRVEIGRRHLDATQLAAIRGEVLVDPPPGLPLEAELVPGMQIMYFADFGTRGLGGPTRADSAGMERDFVDFVRNIGQPPDNDLGGGSFGYGKAAFYIASRAQTILIDTLCKSPDGGERERRFIACGLGDSFDESGRPHTGRHWWGQLVDGVPEPLTGQDARAAASIFGLPDRDGPRDLGTTVVIVAPGVTPESGDGSDPTMPFVAEALVWNFWPRIIDTPGGVARTMSFHLTDDGTRVRLPNPRTHPRLRGFVEAMDRLREEPQGDDEFRPRSFGGVPAPDPGPGASRTAKGRDRTHYGAGSVSAAGCATNRRLRASRRGHAKCRASREIHSGHRARGRPERVLGRFSLCG